MSNLNRTYNWLESLVDGIGVKIPHDVFEELLSSSLHLFVADTDIRAAVDTTVTCADATPGSVALVSACVSESCAESLFDFCEHKGHYARLDWTSLDWEFKKWSGLTLPPWLEKVVAGAPWVVDKSVRCAKLEHVNIQEMRGTRLALVHHVNKSLESRRLVNGTDSRVSLGALGKGRSSSVHLNKIIRSILGWSISQRSKKAYF